MKHFFLFLMLFAFFSSIASSQVIVVLPEFATSEDSVEIIYDASLGDRGLMNYTQAIYAHTGVITNLSTSSTNWRYVKCQWNDNREEIRLAQLGNNKWRLIIPNVRRYYNVPAGEKILGLAFVFRNADGSRTGRDEQGLDILHYFSNPGINVKIAQPTIKTKYYMQNDIANFVVVGYKASKISLFINGKKESETLDDTLNYTFTIGNENLFVKAIAEDSNGNRAYDSLRCIIPAHSAAKDDLDKYFINAMKQQNIGGISAAIFRNDRIIWSNVYGYANIDKSLPVNDSTAFTLASISKTVTAAALMKLFEQGRFRLDDPINNYSPLKVVNSKYPDVPITFKMLLTHSSGITYYAPTLDQMWTNGDTRFSLEEFVREYLVAGGKYYHANNFSNFKPGSAWEYSNEGVALIGYLVEALSGKPFEQYCRENIFDPLNMKHTSFFTSYYDSSEIAMPYYNNRGFITLAGPFGPPDYPAGRLRSSAKELSRFVMAMMNYGKLGDVRILDSSTVKLMLSVHRPIPNGPGQGLIWFWNTYSASPKWEHSGGWWGVSTLTQFDPAAKTGVAVLTTTEANPYQFADEMFRFASRIPVSVYDNELNEGPQNFELGQNYPNPFNPNTIINYQLPKSVTVSLRVYDLLGREVAKLVDGEKSTGTHTAAFDATKLSSGIYFYTLQAGEFLKTKKMMVVK